MKRLLIPIVGLALGCALSAKGQQIQVESVSVDSVKFETQPTPQFEAGNVKGKNIPNPRDWLEIEVEFEAKSNERKAVVPELLFKYYVAIRGTDNMTKILTGDVTHVNVQSGEKYYSAVYVAPATLGKITGDPRRFQAGAVAAVAVEVFHNGVSKGGKSEGGPAGRWWEAAGVSLDQGLLGKDKTPFALLWLDRYADTKAAGGQ